MSETDFVVSKKCLLLQVDLKKRHWLFVLLLQFCSVFVASAQEPFYWHLTDEDGLPSMTVYEIQQAKNGLIWMGTANGLCSYDGKNFQRYNSDKLNDSEILKIRMSSDGIVWGVNLTGQLFYVKDNQINLVTNIGDYQLQKVGDFEWQGDNLWLSDNISFTESNLLSVNKDDKFSLKLNAIQKYGLISCVGIKGNEIIITTYESELNVFSVKANGGLKEKILEIHYKRKERNLRYFLLKAITAMIKSRTVQIFDNNFKYVLDSYKDYENNNLNININTIFADKSDIYVMTNRGVTILNENQKKRIYFSQYSINSILKDKEGNTWVATGGNGVMIVPDFKVDYYNEYNSDIANNKVTSFMAHKNSLLIGHGNGGISSLNNRFELSLEFPMVTNGRIFGMINHLGKILVYGNGGVSYYDFQRKKTEVLLNGGATKSMYIARDNKTLYGGTSFRLGIFKASNYNSFLEHLGIDNWKSFKIDTTILVRTYGIAEDRKGTIWIGSVKGVYTYSPNGEIKFFSQIPYAINYMMKDKLGRIWAASSNNGVFCIDNGEVVKNFNSNNGLSSNCVNTLTSDDQFLWIGTNQGIVRCDLYDYSLFSISKYNGLPTDDIISLASVEQNLLVGTDKGLIRMPFTSIVKNEVPPQVEIKSLKINEKAQNDFSNLQLNYDQNNLNIEFIAYAYKCKGNVTYQYRLVGIDNEWVTTQNREVRFANLSDGDYTFEVVALNEYGIKSSQAAQLVFSINAPFWKKWWFFLGLMLSLAGISALIVRQRYKREQEKREIEQRFQQKIDDLRMQALQSQMNPHFIFNALNAIQHFLTMNDDENATKFLARFARLIRLIFEHNSKKEISLAEEFDMLKVYLSLEKLRFGDKVNIDFSTELPPNINEHSYYLPPLLLQPIIENSFKHGLFHKKISGNLDISFHSYDEKYIACVIEDDGIGRVEAQKINVWRKGKHTSSGLSSAQERIKIWHLQNQQNIPNNGFIIEDLYENDQITPKGTKVTIIF